MNAPTYLNTSLWRPLPPKGVTPSPFFFNPGDSTYCALGLYFKAHGVSDIALAACGFPEELVARWGYKLPKGLTPDIAVTIMELSDGEPARDYAKRQIEVLFNRAGEDVRWTR